MVINPPAIANGGLMIDNMAQTRNYRDFCLFLCFVVSSAKLNLLNHLLSGLPRAQVSDAGALQLCCLGVPFEALWESHWPSL